MIGVRFPAGAGNFSFHHLCVQTSSGAHQASYSMGTGSLSLGVKWPGREADHSPPSSAELKMRGDIPPLLQYVSMVWCLVKHRDNFTFYLYQIWGMHATIQFRICCLHVACYKRPSSSSSSAHEVRPMNDLFRPHNCVRRPFVFSTFVQEFFPVGQ
jgi:hypothetical protein